MVYLEGKLRTQRVGGQGRNQALHDGNFRQPTQDAQQESREASYERICPGRRRTGRSFLAEIKFINTCPPQGGLHQKVKMKVVAIKRDPKCVDPLGAVRQSRGAVSATLNAFVCVLWLITAISWPILRWLLALDVTFQFMRMAVKFMRHGLYFDWIFWSQFVLYVVLICFVSSRRLS